MPSIRKTKKIFKRMLNALSKADNTSGYCFVSDTKTGEFIKSYKGYPIISNSTIKKEHYHFLAYK